MSREIQDGEKSSLEQEVLLRDSPKFTEPGQLREMIQSLRESRTFSNLSVVIEDETDTQSWDIFKSLQKTTLHLGAVSVATLLDAAGFGDSRAVYGVLTPNYEIDADIIGESAIITNVPYANKRLEQNRTAHPDALLLAGGAGYMFNPEVAIKHGADAVMIGKAEFHFLEFLKRLVEYRKEGESLRDVFSRVHVEDIPGIYTAKKGFVDFAPITRDLNEVPPINYDLIQGQQSRFMRSLIGSDGCIHNCDFCSTVRVHRNAYRSRKPSGIVDEMRKGKQLGINRFFWVDDHAFARPPRRIKELLEEIIRADLGARWYAQATVKSINDNLDWGIIDLLEKAKCGVLHLGIESVNDDDLADANASKKNSYDMTVRVLEALDSSPVEVHAMNVLKPFVRPGTVLPYSVQDTEQGRRGFRQEVRELVDVLKRYNVRSTQLNLMIPLPGTKAAERLFNAGIVLKRVGGELVDWSSYTGQKVIASSNPHESSEIMREAYRRFYSTGYILRSPFSRKVLYRTIGKAIVFVNSRIKDRKYAKALKKGDFEFYKPGERFLAD